MLHISCHSLPNEDFVRPNANMHIFSAFMLFLYLYNPFSFRVIITFEISPFSFIVEVEREREEIHSTLGPN